jgi:hypothetical protein
MIEVFIPKMGTYHFLFGENVIGDTSLIIRKKEVVNGKVEGFFTNKVELIKKVQDSSNDMEQIQHRYDQII